MIDEARTKDARVHFASLMDICHLKNAELKSKLQKYNGVFTEQGSSVSQMTVVKVMDIVSRLSGSAGQAADAVFAKIQAKKRILHNY